MCSDMLCTWSVISFETLFLPPSLCYPSVLLDYQNRGYSKKGIVLELVDRTEEQRVICVSQQQQQLVTGMKTYFCESLT
jgi:hypothetical protein